MGYIIRLKATINGDLDDALNMCRFLEEVQRIRPDIQIVDVNVTDAAEVPF